MLNGSTAPTVTSLRIQRPVLFVILSDPERSEGELKGLLAGWWRKGGKARPPTHTELPAQINPILLLQNPRGARQGQLRQVVLVQALD